jgi:preprotein translocase subunit SecG
MLLITLVLIIIVAVLLRRTRVEGPGQEEQGGLGAALGLG